MSTVCCIGTGPSLTLDQIEIARSKGFRLFGANRTFEIVPDLEVMYAVNHAFWDLYYDRAMLHSCEKWTTSLPAARQYGLNWIGERWGSGLCEEPKVIYHGHGSGYSLIGMAHKLGATRIILIGYDMKFGRGYDGKSRQAGETPRHYFGEYEPQLQHWPKQPFTDLLPLYREIHDQGLVEIINCTPGSALEGLIPTASIGDV